MTEPMHWTAPGTRQTACGCDLRGCRSTKQQSLVTCKLCVASAVLRAVERRTGRPPSVGAFMNVPLSRFAAYRRKERL